MAHVGSSVLLSGTLLITSRSSNLPWTDVPTTREGHRVRRPVPDLTIGFPIHNMQELRDARLTVASLSSPPIANFSLSWHRELRGKGITTSPCKILEKDGRIKPSLGKSNRICFPWAIVEIKRDIRPGESPWAIENRCYCQAANACAAALALQEPLGKRLWDELQADIYPIIAFTCIGPIVKTWVAYNRYNGVSVSTVREPPTPSANFDADIDFRRTWSAFIEPTLPRYGAHTLFISSSATCIRTFAIYSDRACWSDCPATGRRVTTSHTNQCYCSLLSRQRSQRKRIHGLSLIKHLDYV